MSILSQHIELEPSIEEILASNDFRRDPVYFPDSFGMSKMIMLDKYDVINPRLLDVTWTFNMADRQDIFAISIYTDGSPTTMQYTRSMSESGRLRAFYDWLKMYTESLVDIAKIIRLSDVEFFNI